MATLDEILAANEAKRLGKTPEQVSNEPGWFEPGSKSVAVARSFADTASLGLGKVVNAVVSPLWSSDPNKSYVDNVKEKMSSEQQANANASEQNPGSYLTGSLVGGAPQALGVVRAGNIAAQGWSKFPIIARSLGMGSAGAAAGAIHGATEATTPSDIPASAGKEALVAGGVNAAIPWVGKAFSGAKDIVKGNTPSGIVSVIKEDPKDVKAADIGNAVAASLGKQISIPALGALAGMGYKNTMSGERPPWETDPYSAALQTGIAGAEGAAMGTAAKWGTKLLGAGADAAMYHSGRALDKTGTYIANSPVGQLATEGTTPGTLVKGRFSQLQNYLKGPQPVAGTEGQSPEVIRKAAMDAAVTPEGRATTNSTSPLEKLMDENVARNTPKDFQAVKDKLLTVEGKNPDALAKKYGYQNIDEWNAENSAKVAPID